MAKMGKTLAKQSWRPELHPWKPLKNLEYNFMSILCHIHRHTVIIKLLILLMLINNNDNTIRLIRIWINLISMK